MQALLCVVILAVVSSAYGQYCQTGGSTNYGQGYGVVSSAWTQTGSTYVDWTIQQKYCNTMCATAVKTSCTSSASNTATSQCSTSGSQTTCSYPLGGSYCLATSTCPSSFTDSGNCQYAFNCSSPACFSGDSTVETRDRSVVSISKLRQGDFVKAFDMSSNKQIFSRFVSYSHADAESVAKFVEVRTSGQKTVKLSDKHLIARRTVAGSSEFVFAQELSVGDVVLTEGEHMETVVSLEETIEKGVFAPLTEQGTVIVDGVVASCYANYRSHEVAHLVHPWVVSIAEFVNTFLGYKDTTEMAEKLNLYGLVSQLGMQSLAL